MPSAERGARSRAWPARTGVFVADVRADGPLCLLLSTQCSAGCGSRTFCARQVLLAFEHLSSLQLAIAGPESTMSLTIEVRVLEGRDLLACDVSKTAYLTNLFSKPEPTSSDPFVTIHIGEQRSAHHASPDADRSRQKLS